jgi:hypothetical protein
MHTTPRGLWGTARVLRIISIVINYLAEVKSPSSRLARPFFPSLPVCGRISLSRMHERTEREAREGKETYAILSPLFCSSSFNLRLLNMFSDVNEDNKFEESDCNR